MTLGLEVNLLTVLACSEFSDLVVRSGNLASFKIHQNAFVQDQAANLKGRAPLPGSSASFDHAPTFHESGEQRPP